MSRAKSEDLTLLDLLADRYGVEVVTKVAERGFAECGTIKEGEEYWITYGSGESLLVGPFKAKYLLDAAVRAFRRSGVQWNPDRLAR